MSRSARVTSVDPMLSREWILDASERTATRLEHEAVELRRLRRRGFERAALNTAILARHHRRYSLELEFGSIPDQAQSGRCWLFGPVVLARAVALRKGSVPAEVSFSATYLYFFNLLEQASATLADLHRMIGRQGSVRDETLRRGLTAEVMGLDDGGEWEWAFNLIHKYGLIPSRAMPETASSQNTKALAVDLHERLARAARAMHRGVDSYEDIRDHAIRDLVRVLVAHLGAPPRVVTNRGKRLTPTEYASEAVGFNAADWRVLISNPLLPLQRVYERRGTAISANSPQYNLRRLNVSQTRLRELVTASLEAGYAVGFSADVLRNDIDHRSGIMHPSIFDRQRVYGSQIVRDLPRREDIYFGVASSKHAMAIVGADVPAGRSTPVKYKVVNSWGVDLGDRGVYHMYAPWFEENVFKLAVHSAVLNDDERAAYLRPVRLRSASFY